MSYFLNLCDCSVPYCASLEAWNWVVAGHHINASHPMSSVWPNPKFSILSGNYFVKTLNCHISSTVRAFDLIPNWWHGVTRIDVMSSYNPIPGFQGGGTVRHTAVTKIEKIWHGFGHYSSYTLWPIYICLLNNLIWQGDKDNKLRKNLFD